MLKPTMQRILATAAQILRRRRTLATFAGLYALLLATLYGFAVVREATLGQVLVTLLLMLAAPLEFFLLQAAIIDNARHGRVSWRRVFRAARKIGAVTLPVIIVSAGLFVLLNQWQSHFPAPTASWLSAEGLASTNEPSPQNLHWPTLLFSTLRWLLFGILLPLVTIHLWILRPEISEISEISNLGSRNSAAAPKHVEETDGSPAALSNLRRTTLLLARAFAPESVLTYTVGLVLFAMIPYALLFVRLPLHGARTDFAVFIARLAFVFLFTLFGWVLTLTVIVHDVFESEAPTVDEEGALVSFRLQAQSL